MVFFRYAKKSGERAVHLIGEGRDAAGSPSSRRLVGCCRSRT
jgi:hypothetical protein